MKSGLVQICSPDRETYQYDRKETVVDTKRKEGNYNHILYSLVIIVLWGLVPSLAKMGNLSGGLTTMYVNWFAVVGVFIIMLANGTIRELWRPQPYGQLVGIGFIWPLVYSILYFSSINRGSGSLTTIANYFWPVFYLICATLLYKKKFDGRNWLVVALAVAGVAVPVFLEANVQLVLLPAVLGLAAALCQALYSLLTEGRKENAWLVTFVVELVTAIGSTIYVAIYEQFVVPDVQTLGYMAFIGVLSNGIGFWAFLKASQESARVPEAKTVFLALMCLAPLVQVVFLPLMGVEMVSQTRWIGVILVTVALAIHRLYPAKEPAPA